MAQALSNPQSTMEDLKPDWQGGALLPLIIPLGLFAESIPAGTKRGSPGLVEKFIQDYFAQNDDKRAFASQALAVLRQRGAPVFFDGLDEVSDLLIRPVVVQSIEAFTKMYAAQASSRFLVTCRTYSYEQDSSWQLPGWPVHELALLDPEKINRFVDAWYHALTELDRGRKASYEHKCERLKSALTPEDRRRLGEIAPFPIILTMMAVVNTSGVELPESRAEVYEILR